MELFCFASKNLTNIWAGIGANLWAVAQTSDSDMRARITKSQKMRVGSFGLLYCNEVHSFTTPFIIYTMPDPIKKIDNIWPEKNWRLPFSIHPLGNPTKQLHKDKAKERWPILIKSKLESVSAAMHITGTTVFVPVIIASEDLEIILQDLKI